MVYMGAIWIQSAGVHGITGVRTLAIRMERAQENAMKVAEFLQSHPKVAWIKYPGLESHPQYRIGQEADERIWFDDEFWVEWRLRGWEKTDGHCASCITGSFAGRC